MERELRLVRFPLGFLVWVPMGATYVSASGF